jgi:adenylate cyclase
MERKLTAILCADVFGYSRLMGEDEEATLRTLSSHRKLIDSLIGQHHGRFVNSAGDSVLAEFASVVNAVQCAVEIQTTLKTENATSPPERRMEFRIGVNLGDVMVDGEQIYGDGVNVAARLESLAEPGGICVSGTVREHLGNRLALSYEDLGAQSVKNIAKPVRVFRVLMEAGGAATPTAQIQGVARKYVRRGIFSVAGLAIIAATVVLVQHLSLRPPAPSASIRSVQTPALTLPDKPSIAVLPFTNMSGDREQEYFSDGVTDDLITTLSRLPDLFVIARTSTFTYKGKAAKVQDISRELGVKYILEGSVRKEANQVRITAQLVDATTGDHLWAEHYDRPLKDIFSLQDEIVRRIVTTLKLQLHLDMHLRYMATFAQHTDNAEAYDYFLRGSEYAATPHMHGTFSAEGTTSKAKEMFEKAIELDPAYADAYGGLGYTYFWSWYSQYSGDDPEFLDRAIVLEQKAIALDDAHAYFAHANLCRFYPLKRQYDEAVAECQRVIELAPGYAYSYFSLAETSNRSGKPKEAIGFVQKAERLDPRNRGLYELDLGVAYILMGRYVEAIPIFKAYFVSYPHIMWAHVWQAVAYAELGRWEEARAEAPEIMRISPGFTLKAERERMSLRDQALEERYINDLRKAGLK